MKRSLFSLVLAVATLTAAWQPLLAAERQQPAPHAATVPDPAQQVQEWARLLRTDDLAGLVYALVPPDQLEQARHDFDRGRTQATSESERARFEAEFARITGPDAVDELMARIEPELDRVRPQAGPALMLGFAAAHMALASPDTDLSDAQRAALRSALPGIQQWATSTDFLSSASMREALTLLTDAIRQTGIGDLDHLRQLSLDDLLYRAQIVLVAAKDALRIYGLDIDAITDSLQVEVLAIEGDSARVRTSVSLFGAPIWSEHELELVNGRWYGKHKFSKGNASGKAGTQG
jgi:hypothetical protein